jgi:hypothetical protein
LQSHIDAREPTFDRQLRHVADAYAGDDDGRARLQARAIVEQCEGLERAADARIRHLRVDQESRRRQDGDHDDSRDQAGQLHRSILAS